MSSEQITDLIERYRIHFDRDSKEGPGSYLAWYAELPGCVAQADSQDAARAHLQMAAAHVLQGIVADGGAPPRPLAELRIRTHRIVVRGGILGKPEDLLNSAARTVDHAVSTSTDVQTRFNELVAV